MTNPHLFGGALKASKLSLLIGILFVVMILLMPVTAVNTQIFEMDTSANSTPTPIVTRGGTRSRVGEDEPNDNYDDAKEIMSIPASIEGGTITAGNYDWFKIELEAGNKVDNLTVSVPVLSGASGTLFIYIYGWFDVNHDGDIDNSNQPSPNNELILMKLHGFTVGAPGSQEAFASAFITGWHYIQLSLSGSGTVNYELYVNVPPEKNTPATSDQYPADATSLSSGSSLYNKHVDMDLDPFDWYKINSPILDPEPEGVNFSIKVELEASLPGQAEDINGEIVDFFTELNMIVLHEGPTADTYVYSAAKRASIQYTSGLPKGIFYYEVKAQPEGKRFEKTYIGFYAHTYGRSRNDPNDIWHGTGKLGNGWVKYSIKKIEALAVYRPKLFNEKVISLATGTEWGRSYDEYEYSINYYQKKDYGPHEMTITINGKDTRKLVKADPSDYEYDSGTDKNPVGVQYVFQYSGLMLGEGNYHAYQIHSRDKNAYAIHSVELGWTNYGPYVSNNFKPYIKPTAVREYTILEDSDPEYLPLSEIFEDSENDSLTFALWNDTLEDITLTYESERINVRVINNSILEFSPKENMSGIDMIKLTVSDDILNYTLQPPLDFTIIIESVNDPPVILQHLGAIQINEDTTYSEINLNNIFSDLVEQTQLEFNHTETSNFDVEIKPNGQLILTPHENWYGTDKITFKANDGFMTLTDVLQITVKPVNDPPFLEFEDVIEVNQSAWCNITFFANDSADGDILTFETNILIIIPELSGNASKYHFYFDSTLGTIS
ncbi:MAG: hypothetical protein KAJ51_04710, partial [Thermoplasmata archaeon]|nr:hypothetical protein [Thermoplasmata archaeon]